MSESALSALFLQNPQLAIALRRRMEAESQAKEGASGEPIKHWAQGVNRLAQGLLGGWQARKAEEEIKGIGDAGDREIAEYSGLAAQLMGRGGQPAAASPPSPPSPPSAISVPSQQGQTSPVGGDMPAIVAAAAQKYGVPIHVAQALVMQESGGDPTRTGRAGEVGLTQILPSTARQPGFGMTGVDPSTLRDPAANADFGMRYLAARAKAAGFDLNNPEHLPQALRLYNGGGDPNYAENVMRRMQGGAPAVSRETAPAGGVSGIPTRPATDIQSALMDIYMRGMASRNPRVQKMAQGMASFIKEPPVATTNEVPLGNGMMQKVISYDQGRSWQSVGVAYDPRGPDRDLTPIADQAGNTTMHPRGQAAGMTSYRAPPPGYSPAQGGGLAPIPGGPADVLIEVTETDPMGKKTTRMVPRTQLMQASGGGAAPGQGGVTSVQDVPAVSPQDRERLGKLETETGRVLDAIGRFREASNAAGPVTAFNALIGNTRSSEGVNLTAAYNVVKTALRSEAFLNTGVLQPAENVMLDRMLLNPETFRGAVASAGGVKALLDQIQGFVVDGLTRQRALTIGQKLQLPSAGAPNAAPAPSRLRFNPATGKIE